MAIALKVKEAVKESLLGTEEQSQLSAQTRTTFLLHAKRDTESGELYMGKDEFVNAIAPLTEDYVRATPGTIHSTATDLPSNNLTSPL